MRKTLRRKVVASSLALAFVVSLAIAASHEGSTARANPSTQPNILVIMTDDQHDQESLNFLPAVRQRLWRYGTRFENSFVSYPLCCPSRATFLTGQYAHNNGVLDNHLPAGGYQKLNHTNTVAQWLKDQGYYTAHIGKYLNRYGIDDNPTVPGTPPAEWPASNYHIWKGSLDGAGTYKYFNFTLNENGTLVTYTNQVNCDDYPQDGACYQTDVYAKHATQFIQERANAPDGKPCRLLDCFRIGFPDLPSGQPRQL